MGSYPQRVEKLAQETWTRAELNDGGSSSDDGADGASDADSFDSMTRDYLANCDADVGADAQAAFVAPSRQPHVDELFAAADDVAHGALSVCMSLRQHHMLARALRHALLASHSSERSA